MRRDSLEYNNEYNENKILNSEMNKAMAIKPILKSVIVPRLQFALNNNPTKELTFLCNTLLEFNEYKENIIINFEDALSLSNEQKKFMYKLNSKIEPLLMDAINMNSIDNRNEYVRRIYRWYMDRCEHFKKLKKIDMRTEKNKDQIDEEEPPKIPPPSLEEIKEHRCEIQGFETANKRIKDYNRKIIYKKNKNEPQNLMNFKDIDNLNYYYKENGFDSTLNNFSKNLNYNPNNDITSNVSTKYETFYKPSNNKIEFKTGTDWFTKTGLDFNKEIKSSYSYLRSKYEFDYLSVEQNILNEKNKNIIEKRNQEEIKKAMMDYGLKKSLYEGNANKKFEMKHILKSYKIKLEEMKKKEEEEKERQRLEEEKRKEELKKKLEEEERKKQEEIKRKLEEEIKKKEEENKDNDSYNNVNDEEEDKEDEEENNKKDDENEEEFNEVILKPKIDINNVKYICQFNTSKAIKKLQRRSTFINDPSKKPPVTVTYYCKVNPIEIKNRTIQNKYQIKYEADNEIIEELKNEQPNKNINDIFFKKQSPLSSDISIYSNYSDNIFKLRNINQKLNNIYLIDKPKDGYQLHMKPLSLYDNLHKRYISFDRPITEGRNKNTDFMFKTFYKFNNDLLNMRKTISNFNENKIRNSKIFKSGNKKLKIQLEEINSIPKDTIFHKYYLPLTGSNLLNAPVEEKKSKKKK